jgi:tRNA U38,U39,U40 pseudouridine synthase TruA
VAALLGVGLGQIDIDTVRTALAGDGPALDGAAAPAKGLCLRHVALGRRPADDKEDEE